MQFIKNLFGKKNPEVVAVPTTKSDIQEKSPQDPIEKLLEEYVLEQCHGKQYLYNLSVGRCNAGKSILKSSPEESKKIVLEANKRLSILLKNTDPNFTYHGLNNRKESVCYESICKTLLRRKLDFTDTELTQLIEDNLGYKHFNLYTQPIAGVISAIENFFDTCTPSDNLKDQIIKLTTKVNAYGSAKEYRQLSNRLKAVLGENRDIPLLPGEAWSDDAINMLRKLHTENHEQFDQFIELLNHCSSSNSSKPSAKWLKEAKNLIEPIGFSVIRDLCLTWFRLVDKPKTVTEERRNNWEPDPNLVLNDANADVLKGLVWVMSIEENAEIARSLVFVALSCFKKVPGLGPRAVRVGNAVIHTLSTMPGKTGLYQLAILKVKIKYRSSLNILNKALNTAAEREGLTLDELEEMGVPSFALDEVGQGKEEIGDCAALIKVSGFNSVDLLWQNAMGKTQKAIPSNIKDEYQSDIKEVKGAVKDIKSMLSVQKERLEQLFLKEREWDFDTWRDRYVEHPLVGVIARNLIWRFSKDGDSFLAIHKDGIFIDVNAKEASVGDSTVSLWHPITSDIDEIRAWRSFLEMHEIRQPFKQAHREVYLLTDAEINTRVYSNRFASHIIKQHQFNALASTRGWRYQLQGCWDGGSDSIAQLELNRFNLLAEFWVHGIGEYGNDTTEAGIFSYVSTDQVRFYNTKTSIDNVNASNINNASSVELTEVPKLVLSEVLRDVDLFVGVCSVGNDPEWSDGGPDGRYRDYWHSYSFGDLSASAKTRKEILENLVPKLKIGPQCKFVDKFLVVEGKRRIYKIHLGSGNILMEPNNQYLCIVKDNRKSTTASKVFLPFEGDNMLSIILSKAVLLADDDKIKDSTINSQINHYQ